MVAMGFVELLFFLVMSGLGGQAGLPLGMPPGPEDPMVLNFAPDNCVFYTNWSPTVAADPTNNPTEKWMAQPEVKKAFEKIRLALGTKAGDDPFGKTALAIADRLLLNGAGVYVSELEMVREGANFKGGLIVKLGPEAKQFTAILAKALSDGQVANTEMKETTINGIKFFETNSQLPNDAPAHFGVVKDEYLVAAVGEGEMNKLLANLDTEQPDWLSRVRGDSDVQRISSVTYLNVPALVEAFVAFGEENGEAETVTAFVKALGFENVTSAGWVSGLDSEGFLCRGRINIEGEPAGMFDIFDDEGLAPEHMSRIADDRMAVFGASLSAAKIVDLFRSLFDVLPFTRGEFDSGIDQLNAELGIDVEADVFEKLDGQAYVYGSINMANPTAGWLLGFRISDEEFKDTYEKVVDVVRDRSEEDEYTEFKEKEINGATMYTLENKRDWGDPDVSWAYSNGEVLFSMDKGSIRKHLRREEMEMDAMVRNEWFSKVYEPQRMDSEGPFYVGSLDVADVVRVALPLATVFGGKEIERALGFSMNDLPSSKTLTAEMQPNLMSLFKTPEGFEIVQRQTYPGGTPGTLIGGAAVGGLAASATLRNVAAATTSKNNARAMVLAMHNYHDSLGAFPTRFTQDDEDKPLLSWRVHILPYLGYQDLYEEFHLDEAWDSDHNKALLEKMPPEFKHPRMELEAGKTPYVVAAGEGVALSDPSDDTEKNPTGNGFRNITDGTSNTGLVFEVKADEAVFWTQPKDLDCGGDEDPFGKLFQGWDSGKINVSLADGSIQSFSPEKVREVFKELVNIADGEVIDLWDDE